jgi:hypothetical protein
VSFPVQFIGAVVRLCKLANPYVSPCKNRSKVNTEYLSATRWGRFFFAVSFCKGVVIFTLLNHRICCAANSIFPSVRRPKAGVAFSPNPEKNNPNTASKTMSKVVGYSLIFFLDLVPSACLDIGVELYRKRLYLGDC